MGRWSRKAGPGVDRPAPGMVLLETGRSAWHGCEAGRHVGCLAGRGSLGRMRRDWRKVLAFAGLVPRGRGGDAAPQERSRPETPADLRSGVGPADDRADLGASGRQRRSGRTGFGPGRSELERGPRARGHCRGRRGRGQRRQSARLGARRKAALEARRPARGPRRQPGSRPAPEARLVVIGGGIRSVTLPISAVLERVPSERRRTSAIALSVERLAWDAAFRGHLGPTVAEGIVGAGGGDRRLARVEHRQPPTRRR